MNETFLQKKGKRNFVGVQTVSTDVDRVRGWDLLTHGGFVTYPHHDASGLATFVNVRSGSKIWAYIDTPGSSQKTLEEIAPMWDEIFSDNIELAFKKYNIGVLLLKPGDTL